MTYIKPEQSVMNAFSIRFERLTNQYDPKATNKDLGKLFGVSSTTIFKWKRAQAMPKMENACLIALQYDACVEWLLTGRGKQRPIQSLSELDLIMEALPPDAQARVLDSARAFLALHQQSLSQSPPAV